MDDLKRFEYEEAERAEHAAKRALAYWRTTSADVEADLAILARLVYDIGPDGREHQYLSTGNLAQLSGLASKILLPVFPMPPEDFSRYYGLDVNDFVYLADAGVICPLMQSATRYNGYPHLHDLLSCTPRDYFVRSALFYCILVDGDIAPRRDVGGIGYTPGMCEFVTMGREAARKEDVWRTAELREPYQRHRSFATPLDERERVIESLGFRYASVAAFLGRELVDELLEALGPEVGWSLLLHLHVELDHTATQGLFFPRHDDTASAAWHETDRWRTTIVRALEQPVDLPVVLPLPDQPSRMEILRMHHLGVPVTAQRLVDAVMGGMGVLQIRELIAQLADEVHRVQVTCRKVVRAVQFTSLAASAPLAGIDVWAGVAGILGAIALPEWVVECVASRLRQWKVRRFVRNYWGTIVPPATETMWKPPPGGTS